MTVINITFFLVILLAFVSSAILKEDIGIAKNDNPLESSQAVQLPDHDQSSLSDGVALNDIYRRGNRLSLKWYSGTYVRNNYLTWWFHESTHFFNITIPEPICETEMIGTWEFMNGSLKYDATWADINTDLAIGKTTLSQQDRASAVIKNALLALTAAQEFLEEYILCPSERSVSASTGRNLLWNSQGRVTAVIIQTTLGLLLGMLAGEIINGFHADINQIFGTGFAVGGPALLYGIITIMRDNNAFVGFERMIIPKTPNPEDSRPKHMLSKQWPLLMPKFS